jgi:pyrroloquinoline quinone (PQQ) biosynthesis protein C
MENAIYEATVEKETASLVSDQYVHYTDSLDKFLESWDKDYANSIKDIPMFDGALTSKWSEAQRKFFVKTLYHARGHFHDVLWYMGNFAPNKKMKQLILDNIADEFNGNSLSHEALYLFFAKAVGVDLSYEALEEEVYLPFLKEFNKGHLRWLREHDADCRISFFAALERLDCIDYIKGKEIAESFGLKNKDLIFFNVHIHADHFNPVFSSFLLELWKTTPHKIKDAFHFIRTHQAKMWAELSNTVFAYKG